MLVRDIAPPGRNAKSKTRAPCVFLLEDGLPASADLVRGIMYLITAACITLFVINAFSLYTAGLQLKTEIAAAAAHGFEQILDGSTSLGKGHFEVAKGLFKEAGESFEKMQNDTWFIQSDSSFIKVRDPNMTSIEALSQAGLHLANAGRNFTLSVKELQELPNLIFEANQLSSEIPRSSLTEKLTAQLPQIARALISLKDAQDQIAQVHTALIPERLRTKFNIAKESLSNLVTFMEGLATDMPSILKLLGDKEPHTFLLLLQNSAELRPTGGFIGNIMLIEINDGYVTKRAIEDVYSRDHQLTDVISPPAEILPVNERWFLRDSNYSAHFPLSAQKAAWFLEKENGPGVDTVIAIDQSVVADFLRATGPISIEQLSKPITSDNFSAIFSYIIESKLAGRENPKQILADFVPAFQRSFFASADPLAVMPILQSSIQAKRIQAYSKDSAIQDFWQRNGMTGIMEKPKLDEDYLAIVRTSIGGNKSDDHIAEVLMHDTHIERDGSIVDEVTIEKRHTWTASSEAKIRSVMNEFGFSSVSRHVLEILGRSRNIQMLRLYVPFGATLVEASDTSITTHTDPELDLTYFSALMTTHVNDKSMLTVRYRLPFKLNLDPVHTYKLKVQKQAGHEGALLTKRIFTDKSITHYKNFPEPDFVDQDGMVKYEMEMASDMNFTSVIGK